MERSRRLGLTYFHNEFTNGIEFVPQSGLAELGVPPALLPTVEFGAYVNSEAFRALGLEFEAEYRINSHLFARGGYTYTDAVVQRSFSSDQGVGASFNPAFNFADIPIGAFFATCGCSAISCRSSLGIFWPELYAVKVLQLAHGYIGQSTGRQ